MATIMAMGIRKPNPTWDTCDLTDIQADVRVDGNRSTVKVRIGVKNNGPKPATEFMIPLRPTTAGFGTETGAPTFETMVLVIEAIGPGQEVHAEGEFSVEGQPKGLWVGVLL
jgi:hypothetical protein